MIAHDVHGKNLNLVGQSCDMEDRICDMLRIEGMFCFHARSQIKPKSNEQLAHVCLPPVRLHRALRKRKSHISERSTWNGHSD
jgi:hypothetical protein